jgi:hypothetical protein
MRRLLPAEEQVARVDLADPVARVPVVRVVRVARVARRPRDRPVAVGARTRLSTLIMKL